MDDAEKCPCDLLEMPVIQTLDKWFIIEARREDGKRYPATSINQLLAGLLC